MLPQRLLVVRKFGLAILLLLACWACHAVVAGDKDAMKDTARAVDKADGNAFFEAKIRPVLVKHCQKCHSREAPTPEGGLRVDTRAAIRAGGDHGPAVVPGNADKSLLLKAVSRTDPRLKMPPKERLPDAVVADLKKWIEMGAPDPRDEPAGSTAKKPYPKATKSFWSYQPPKDPVVPKVKDGTWAKKDLDRFVIARLEAEGLTPSADATPETLLRRLHFDLVGLPPTPLAMERFRKRIKADGLDAALGRETDELLASPGFGEKWGRHWLDVARFGESSGGQANISFPYAWRYRDYVIDAVNQDIPFDRFLIEQIAGDLLPAKNDVERTRLLIATGYLAVGPKPLDAASDKQFQADVVDEQIDALTRGVLANSVACARCHDHKFDPFTMADYYALAGFFTSTRTFFGTAISPANQIGGEPLVLPRIEGQKIFHASISAKQVEKLKKDLAALQKEKADGEAAIRKAIKDGKDTDGIFTIQDALRIFWRSGGIKGELAKVDDSGRALPLTMGVLDRDKVSDAPLLERGEVGKRGKAVPRRIPDVFATGDGLKIPAGKSGRLELARWLTHPKHPLTARVITNRIWHNLLGAGLVRTVDNFGASGELPSHPELLDHLALRFVKNSWSVKKLVKEIVLSRTYRQASTFDARKFARDPDNRLLWRASKRRLPAEAIRDAMLAVSGDLDSKRPEGSLVARVIGDRPISLIGLDKKVPADLDGSVHRSVYLPVIRDRLPDALELFDFAEPGLVTGHRETTNVPVQALYLMNSPFVQARSAAMAKRLQSDAKADADRLDLAFRLCFARSPGPEEKKRCLKFLDKGNSLTAFCQALLCMAEFRNLD